MHDRTVRSTPPRSRPPLSLRPRARSRAAVHGSRHPRPLRRRPRRHALGDRVQAIPLVVSGSIRVFQSGETGRAITIYRFGAGECCVLAADSILGDRLFPASAQVFEEAEVALVPAPLFNDWLARFPAWRAFVFGAMARRLTSLMDTLEQVAFTRMDARVLSLLLARSEGRRAPLPITHQEIADELGSSREVISRILGRFQDQGLVHAARGEIEVLDAALAVESNLRD